MLEISLKSLQCIEKIDEKLTLIASRIKEIAAAQVKTDSWPDMILLNHAIDQSTISLAQHLELLDVGAQVLLHTGDDSGDSAKDMETLLKEWNVDKNPPSLLSLCLFALEDLRLKPQPDDMNMLMVCAILGQVQNKVPYHSDMHFRKVLAQAIRLIINHNYIFDGTDRALDVSEVCLLLTAACIHDLGHDGRGNYIKGVHIEGRAEKVSFELAKPYMIAAGCEDATLSRLYTMLLTTDVSPLDDPGNPMMQMKAAYRFHFMGEGHKALSLNLSPELKILEKDPKLAMLCQLLHEADISTSAGITYEVTKYETALLMEEVRDEAAYPSQVIGFLDQICQRRFLSDAGQKLYAANIARIYSLAEKDVKDGDESFPPSIQLSFNPNISEKPSGKTIN